MRRQACLQAAFYFDDRELTLGNIVKGRPLSLVSHMQASLSLIGYGTKFFWEMHVTEFDCISKRKN